MCGLIALFDLHSTRDVDVALVERMNEVQRHRGPDGGNIHIESGLGLGHRRLSVIDLTSGIQPLFNEDQSVVVVYNGEIYNFRELTEELKRAGHQFATHCDTEVIVHAWEQWGPACVQRFRGMFAFVVWDRNQKILFLARDRLGIKPLYYGVDRNGWLYVASELKGILACAEFPREMDPEAVEEYFSYGYIPEPKTILKDVAKLPPGHTLQITRGGKIPAPREYWDVPFRTVNNRDEEATGKELVERLQEAVRIRLVADVPLGAFLSGGVDSSAVVALMAGLSDKPVNTCSISFGDPKYNEAEYANQVAELYGCNHHTEQVSAEDFDLIDHLADLYDEPFADSSAIPTFRVCGLARRRVTVALSGDGGDENMAGYRRYRWHLYEESMRRLLPHRVRSLLFGGLAKIYPKADWAPKPFRAKATFEALARDTVEGYFHSISIFGEGLRSQLFSPQFKRGLQGYRGIQVLHRHMAHSPSDHPLSRIQYLDLKTYLVGDILTKVDRASMAHGLEVRVPILDHEFVEWMSGLPAELKLKGREGKYLLKKALRPYLPDNILYRQKMGFAVPLCSWFRGPLRDRVRESVLGSTLEGTGIFDMAFLRTMVDQHQSGRRDFSAQIWALMMFESFQRKVMMGEGR